VGGGELFVVVTRGVRNFVAGPFVGGVERVLVGDARHGRHERRQRRRGQVFFFDLARLFSRDFGRDLRAGRRLGGGRGRRGRLWLGGRDVGGRLGHEVERRLDVDVLRGRLADDEALEERREVIDVAVLLHFEPLAALRRQG